MQPRALVIDGNRTVANILKQKLEAELGLDVVTAHGLDEVEKALSGDGFFVATSNLVLSGARDGQAAEMCLSAGVPTIVLTSTMDQKTRESLLSKGVMDYVLKDRNSTAKILESVRRFQKNLGARILVVDDSRSMRLMYQRLLTPHGFEVLEAIHGAHGLRILEEIEDVRMAIVDYEMPEMDGFEFCAGAREKYDKARLPIIGVSSFQEELFSVRFLKKGANDFLSKPFQAEELYARIVQNLEMQEHVDELNRSMDTIRRMNERMKRDLDAAARLQGSLVPTRLPEVEGIRARSLYAPCDELSGDAFNVLALDESTLAVYVADVSGHGVPAALLSVSLSRIMTPEYLMEDFGDGSDPVAREPGEVCAMLNSRFPMDWETMQYFTLVYGLLDLETGAFRFATAGHPGPVVLRRGGKADCSRTLSPGIGLVDESEFDTESISLSPGDRVYLFTDGIVEPADENGEEFGVEGICRVIEDKADAPLEAGLEALHRAVTGHAAKKLGDDLTVCCLEYAGRT